MEEEALEKEKVGEVIIMIEPPKEMPPVTII